MGANVASRNQDADAQPEVDPIAPTGLLFHIPLVLAPLALLSATPAQKDAMAQAVLHTLSENWAALVADFRQLNMIPAEPSIWVDKKTELPISGLKPGKWKAVAQVHGPGFVSMVTWADSRSWVLEGWGPFGRPGTHAGFLTGGFNRAPQNGGVREKGSIDRTINH